MPAFDSFDGLRLHYEVSGSGMPVVLLHSFPFDSRVWTGTASFQRSLQPVERRSPWTAAVTGSPTSRTILRPTATMRRRATFPASSITWACHRLISLRTPLVPTSGCGSYRTSRGSVERCSVVWVRGYSSGTRAR